MTTMNRKNALIAAIVVSLVVLNAWRWWPSSQVSAVQGRGVSAAFHLEDFEVKALPSDSRIPFSRDVFHPKRIEVPKPVVKAVPKANEPPPKSPEELAYDAAQAEFSQIRCLGISVRNKHYQAYLSKTGDHLLVSAGDKVGRFVVEKITSDGVMLHDPETGFGGQVALSGK